MSSRKDYFLDDADTELAIGAEQSNLPSDAQIELPEQRPHVFGSSSVAIEESFGPGEELVDDQALAVLLRDGLDQPIVNQEVKILRDGVAQFEGRTDQHGAVILPDIESKNGQLILSVKDLHGRDQEVCKIDLAKCSGGIAVARSPKVLATLPTRPHNEKRPSKVPPQGAKPVAQTKSNTASATGHPQGQQSAPWYAANGALEKAAHWLRQHMHASDIQAPQTGLGKEPHASKQAANTSGNPIAAVVGPECPNRDNLCLGQNNLYRQFIVEASKRLGLIPQAICALIDCEASKVAVTIEVRDTEGRPRIDKAGKPITRKIGDVWNSHASNVQSGAAGMTQFLASTWLNHALRPGFYIHDECVKRGWVSYETKSKGKKLPVFVLSDNSRTSEPAKYRNDDHVKLCLSLRMEPAFSINAAADYGNANLQVLKAKGFKLSGLSDMDKAKLMYLMHHEGEGAGPAFIPNTLDQLKGGVDGLKKKFAMQLGQNGAAKVNAAIAKADGDVVYAYRLWLAKFIDDKFRESKKYFCSNTVEPMGMSKLMAAIGGEKI
jgi:hypothetical protein